MISRQQRDVNRSPDPVLKITAVASARLLACEARETNPNICESIHFPRNLKLHHENRLWPDKIVRTVAHGDKLDHKS